MSAEEKILLELYRNYAGMNAKGITLLPGSGSYRKYYRIGTNADPVIGVWNDDRKENEAFLSFSRHFHKVGLPVPVILAVSETQPVYLLSDLGDQTLFGVLSDRRSDRGDFPAELFALYKKVITRLPGFQVDAAKELDYSKCYPRAVFDRQSMMWDLNYFKYYFLKLARIPFDEQELENDFLALTDFLLTADSNFFMYRDFQSRNVMIVDSEPWFIDYQGGRQGPLQYDIASLLYDAKAAIPESVREELLSYYLDELQRKMPVDRESFLRLYYGFVLIRILQALGAYGFRGYYEHKPHFLQSIPYAVANLKYLLEQDKLPVNIPFLTRVLKLIIGNRDLQHIRVKETALVVSVMSFSYKNGIPKDKGGHGGGFIFDCRALPNPGKLPEYKDYTGKDPQVIGFLKKEPSVDEFLLHSFALVDHSIANYIERDFARLSVAFGCTGGQHRSVYCAEALANHLRSKFSVRVEINHTESVNFPA